MYEILDLVIKDELDKMRRDRTQEPLPLRLPLPQPPLPSEERGSADKREAPGPGVIILDM